MPQNPPTSFIEAAHAAALESLSLDDAADIEDAERGFLGARKPAAITNESPGVDITGDAGALQMLLAALDRPDPDFDIVTLDILRLTNR